MKKGETALDGLLVVELGTRIGVGVCGSLLAQLGATVVCVEAEARVPFAGKSRYRPLLAAGKLSLVPDASERRDRDLVARLIAQSGVVLCSSDIDAAAFAAPKGTSDGPVVCDITAYGATGPLAGKADTDLQIEAASGIIDTTGMADGPPAAIGLPLLEFLTGIYAAAAAIAALRVKRLGGAAQGIDMALYDCAFASLASFLPPVLKSEPSEVRRLGNCHPMAAPWNVYSARDGWVLICTVSDEQWRRLCGVIARPELASAPGYARLADRVARRADTDAVVEAWVGRHAVADCVVRLGAANIACGPIATIEDFPREPNLEHRSMIRQLFDPVAARNVYVPGSPLRMSVTPARNAARLSNPDEDRAAVRRLADIARPPSAHNRIAAGPRSLPLQGVRVIEIGHYTTAPLAARLMASLGAEVVKIEPPQGEPTRAMPPMQNGQSYYFTLTNAGKKSLALDLDTQSGAKILKRLIETSDVLIENLKPGALAARGFATAAIGRINPRLVYCAVSGFGANSLYPSRPAFDTVIQAMSGIMDIVRAEGIPVKTGISSADLAGAEMALVAVLGALEYRDRTGRGQTIDLSMQDITAWLTQTAWNGEKEAQPRSTLLLCRDGYIVLPELDARFLRVSETPGRGEGAVKAQASREELAAELSSRGIAAAPVLSVREMIALPQTSERGLWLTVAHEGLTWPLLRSPLRLLGTPPAVKEPTASPGHDGPAILAAIGIENGGST